MAADGSKAGDPTPADGATDVVMEIAAHARRAGGGIAPAVAGLSAWAAAHGVAAEHTLPFEKGEPECGRTAARMVLAPLGGVDLAASPTLSYELQRAVYDNADNVLGGLNRLGRRCLEILGKPSPIPETERTTRALPAPTPAPQKRSEPHLTA